MTNIQSKVPLLRFPEYKGNWKRIELGNIGSFLNGLTYSPDNIRGEGLLVLRSSNVQGGRLAFKDNVFVNVEVKEELLSKLGDILICVRNGSKKLIGKNALITEECPKATHGAFMSVFRSEDSNFAFQLLQTEKYRRQVFVDLGATINSINGSNLKKYKFYSPKSREAEEISTFLSTVDKKISLLKQKHEHLVQYKKGVMQQLFSQQLRFKYDNGQDFPDWEDKKLNTLLTEHKKRNRDLKYNKGDVLSVSGELGVINQIEHLGRSYAGESVRDYHIVHEGDIVYTKSPLKANPYGIIKANKGKAGIVSTLYAVYSCKNTANYEYLEYYFWIDANTNRYLRPLVQKGAKNDMKINNQRVLIDRISVPSKQEQDKIVKFLKALDEKIFLAGQQLEQTQAYKQGLLQQMFV